MPPTMPYRRCRRAGADRWRGASNSSFTRTRGDELRTRRRLGLFLLEAAVALPAATTIVYADTIRVEATRHGDRAKVVLAWPAPVGFSTEERDGRLIVRFDRPVEGDP